MNAQLNTLNLLLNSVTIHLQPHAFSLFAWEQRKLGEIEKTQSGIGFSETEQGAKTAFHSIKFPIWTIKGNENEMLTANNYVSEEQVEKKIETY